MANTPLGPTRVPPLAVQPGVPDDMPTPVPISGSTTPGGTPRPRAPLTTLDEAAHLREVAAALSTSQEVDASAAPPPGRSSGDERDRQHLERRLGRLEGALSTLIHSQARQLDNQTDQKREQKKNTSLTKKAALASQIGAYGMTALTLFALLSKALGDWGEAHPGAPITLAVVVTLIIRVAAALAPRLAAGSDGEPPDAPAGPPPGST